MRIETTRWKREQRASQALSGFYRDKTEPLKTTSTLIPPWKLKKIACGRKNRVRKFAAKIRGKAASPKRQLEARRKGMAALQISTAHASEHQIDLQISTAHAMNIK